MMPHLLVDISGHGYGHVSQTAPVVNALVRRMPGLRVTVRSDAPEALLRQRLNVDFAHLPLGFDFGMKMASAVEVLPEASHAAYRNLHANWTERVAVEAGRMADLKPDLLLANVPYLSLAAAEHGGIPAVALCSLNWADIYHHYCQAFEGAEVIYAQMLTAYRSARYFLQAQPSMPMPGLLNLIQIGTIASPGNSHRHALASRLGLADSERCVLVAMGGMDYRVPVDRWPVHTDIRWLLPASWGIQRADISVFDGIGWAFGDILASCDAVLTKPGYGTFAEAACLGIPLLYAPRGDWPETRFLVEWLSEHVPCKEVSHAALQSGALYPLLEALWMPRNRETVIPEGAETAAGLLQGMIEYHT